MSLRMEPSDVHRCWCSSHAKYVETSLVLPATGKVIVHKETCKIYTEHDLRLPFFAMFLEAKIYDVAGCSRSAIFGHTKSVETFSKDVAH